jgi:hypothetical protein
VGTHLLPAAAPKGPTLVATKSSRTSSKHDAHQALGLHWDIRSSAWLQRTREKDTMQHLDRNLNTRKWRALDQIKPL